MEKNNCTLNGHTYDIWEFYDETHVSRNCIDCNHKEIFPLILPLEIDKFNQIKLQQQAIKKLNNFLNLDTNDEYIIHYIYEMINEHFSFLSKENQIKLAMKLNEIILTSSMTEENKKLLQNFIISIRERNFDLGFDTIDYFKEYNKNILTTPPHEIKTNLTK